VKKIVFTGAESCGKTFAATLISNTHNLVFVPEYAREYLKEKKTNYDYGDIIRIATLQYNAENEATNTSIGDIVFDTDLVTIKIWLEYMEWEVPIWIENCIKGYRDRHYFLMTPNIPWIDDGLRTLEGNRLAIHQLYKKELTIQGFNFFEIDSKLDAREKEIKDLYQSLTTQNA
jgi:HTH-type transcriptional repressor of NAD biosynthesis genes